MDRKIVFRAWYKGRPDFMPSSQSEEHKPQMIYRVESLYNGSIINGGQVKPYPCLSLWMHFGDLIDNPDFILMQFTGLFDKNERAIYEGDIYVWKKKLAREKGFIEYRDDGFRCIVTQHSKHRSIDVWPLMSMSPYLEVIGNIYENPELLTL